MKKSVELAVELAATAHEIEIALRLYQPSARVRQRDNLILNAAHHIRVLNHDFAVLQQLHISEEKERELRPMEA